MQLPPPSPPPHSHPTQVLTDNPLADFVELPDEYRELRYCNVLAGVVRGALEMVREDGGCGKGWGCKFGCVSTVALGRKRVHESPIRPYGIAM